MNIKIPKIELHVHLSGSVRISTIAELAGITEEEAQLNVVEPPIYDKNGKKDEKFELALSVMQTKDNLIRISREFAEDLKEDNVIYAEVRVEPTKHLKCNLTLDEVVESVLMGFKEVDLKANLILCMMYNETYEKNKEIVLLAKKFLNNGVVGLDLVGTETIVELSDYKELFMIAKSLDIPYTIHAGELDDWSNLLTAIEFGAKRIGHGVRAIENRNILNLIKQKNILLEICPTSNVQVGIVKSIFAHPINEFKKLGVKISINTDNRTVSFTNLENEYKKLANSFKYDINDFCKFNKMAIEASFLSKFEKDKLNSIIDEYMKQFS